MKNVTFCLATALIFVGSLSQASQPTLVCTNSDFQIISAALNSVAAVGEQFRSEVQGMLAEEMGPTCANTSTFSPGIPGNQYYSYLLNSGGRRFQLKIVIGGVEEPGTKISIEKN